MLRSVISPKIIRKRKKKKHRATEKKDIIEIYINVTHKSILYTCFHTKNNNRKEEWKRFFFLLSSWLRCRFYLGKLCPILLSTDRNFSFRFSFFFLHPRKSDDLLLFSSVFGLSLYIARYMGTLVHVTM